MIEVVNASVLPGGARKPTPDTNVSSGSPLRTVEVASVQEPAPHVGSRIRVDNQAKIAILEFVSQSGEVKESYPNRTQIEAFQQAERLKVGRGRADDAAADVAERKAEVSSAPPAPSQPKVAPPPTPVSTPAPTDAGSGVVVSDSSSVVV